MKYALDQECIPRLPPEILRTKTSNAKIKYLQSKNLRRKLKRNLSMNCDFKKRRWKHKLPIKMKQSKWLTSISAFPFVYCYFSLLHESLFYVLTHRYLFLLTRTSSHCRYVKNQIFHYITLNSGSLRASFKRL